MNATYGNDAKAMWRQVCAIVIAAWLMLRSTRIGFTVASIASLFGFVSAVVWLPYFSSALTRIWWTQFAFGGVLLQVALILFLFTLFMLLAAMSLYNFLAPTVFPQIDPTLARTVPAMMRAARVALALIIATLASCTAAWAAWFATTSYGHAWAEVFRTTPDGHVVNAAALAAGISATAMVSGGLRDLAVRVLAGTLALLSPNFIIAGGFAPNLPALPITVATAGLMVFWALRGDLIVPRQKQWDKRQERLGRFSRSRSFVMGEVAFFSRFFGKRYDRSMQRALDTPQPAHTSLMALGLGPHLQWGAALSLSLRFMLVSVAIFGLLAMCEGGALSFPLILGMMFASLIYGLDMDLNGLKGGLLGLRREQALLRLAPGGPQGPDLNRWFAVHLGRFHFAKMGLVACASPALTVLVITLVDEILYRLGFYATSLDRVELSARLAVAMLVLMAGSVMTLSNLRHLWFDWSASDSPSRLEQLSDLLLCVVLHATPTFLLFFLVLSHPADVASIWKLAGTGAALAACVAVLVMFSVIRRWKAMMRAPVAWPVGRR